MKNKLSLYNRIINRIFPHKKQIQELQKQVGDLSSSMLKLISEKHEMIIEDREKIENLSLSMLKLISEKHEMIIEDREEIENLSLSMLKLISEKHEMIMEDREKIENLSLSMLKLISEKHEMIIADREKMENLSLSMLKLMSEKHEMILKNSKEIQELVRINIIRYYAINPDDSKKEEIKFLKKNSLQMYPYEWTKEYKKRSIVCIQDDDGWHYVMHSGKKMYFPLDYTVEMIKEYYLFLIMEQDARSPHKYNYSSITEETVFIDAGAAEGMMSLEIIERIKCAVIIECDNGWILALERTFRPYNNKVRIIAKYVGDITDNNSIRISDIAKKEEHYIIKIDVEGSEVKVLNGMRGVRLNSKSQILICCYHNQKDEESIVNYFERQHMKYEFTKGYILSMWGGYCAPYFRRGICSAHCESESILLE